MGRYADTLRKIDEIQRGDDYFKSIIQLGDLAAELARENFKLEMGMEIKEEAMKSLEDSRDWWREWCKEINFERKVA